MRILCIGMFFGLMTSISFALPPGAESWPAECDDGKAVSCFYHGIRLYNGDEIEQNSVLAIDYARRACNMGQADACFMAGEILFHGRKNIPQMKEKAFEFFDLACAYNFHSKDACYYAARANSETGGDSDKTLQLALKGCENNEYWSCQLMTSTYMFGKNGQPENVAKALPFATKGCDLGHGWSCSVAGKIFDGEDPAVSRNSKLRLQYADKGCDLGEGLSCYTLGFILLNGEADIEANKPQALQYMDRGCEIGDLQSCAGAGWEFAADNQLEKAIDYLTIACNGEYEDTCYSVAHLNFLLDNYSEALPVLSATCQEGDNPLACRMAGSTVVELEGPSASRNWYQRGCELGDQESCRYINDLNRYEREQAENERVYAAQIAERNAGSGRVTEALNAGNYASAMEIATYGIGSRADVSRVVLAADSAGALSQIDPFYFTFLETWLAVDYQQANAIVRREYLKNPDGVTASAVSSRGAPTVTSGQTEPSLSDQFFQNQKETYRRQLDWANRGGNPAGFEVNRN